VAHTHNVRLWPAEEQALMGLVQIPTRKTALQVAGVAGIAATMGGRTCAVLPEAMNSARTVARFGCIGNRVDTGAEGTEAYFAIPGLHLDGVEEKLASDRAR